MEDKKLGAVEARFADLIWDNAPIWKIAKSYLCSLSARNRPLRNWNGNTVLL